MAVRTIKQIEKQLARTDKPTESLLKSQIQAIPGTIKQARKGLQAQQQQAFQNILSGAKSRGLKFSGIPLAEQAEFTSTQFLPALAQLERTGQESRVGLQSSLADVIRQRGILAQQLRQGDIDRNEARQARLASQRAAQAQSAGFSDIINSLLGGGAPAGGELPKPTKKQERKQIIKDAQGYAERINTSIKDENLRAQIFQGLRKRATEKGDFQAMAQFNALSKLIGSTSQFNLNTGKLNTGDFRFFNDRGIAPLGEISSRQQSAFLADTF